MAATKALELAQIANTLDVSANGEITNIGTLSSIETTGDATFGANATFSDNGVASFGDSSDLQIFHDGNHSYIKDTGQGDLRILASDDLRIADADNNPFLNGNAGAHVQLYYAGSEKLATTTSGIDVTGTITTDDLVVSGNLTVSGTMTSINSDNLEIEDLNITLANGAADATAANGAGLTVEGANAQLTYDSTQNRWNMNKGLELIGTPLVVGTGTTDVGRVENSAGVFSLYAYTGRQIAFGNDTNGEHVRIDAAGKVGIGTDSPLDILHVESSSGDVRQLMNAPTGSDAEIKFAENGTVKFTIGHDAGTGNFVIGTTNVDTSRRFVIDSSGDVGIGSSATPASTLDVGGAITLSGDTEHQIVKKTTSAITGGTTDVTEIKGRQIDLYSYDDVWLRAGTADDIGFVAGGSTRLTVLSTGHVVPGADNTQNLGSASARWANIYTGDLHLSNEGSQNEVDGTSGNWTIQEGEEHLYIINNKSGKKYKFALEEIE